MEPNQNPPSERDWSEREKEEFFASMGLTGTPINKEPFHPTVHEQLLIKIWRNNEN